MKKEHRSFPRNKLIAKIFFYVGLIEQWGSGVTKMIGEAKAAGHPKPLFEELGGFRVTFGAKPVVASQPTPQPTPQAQRNLTELEIKVLKFCKTPRTRHNIVKKTGMNADYIRKELLPKMINAGRLTLIFPDKPNHPQQKYVAGQKGK